MFTDAVGNLASARVNFRLAGGAQPLMGPVTIGGAHVEMRGGTLQALQVGGARIENAAAMIGEFLSMLSEAAGARLEGIVGYNFLRNYKVVIDYPNQMLSLLSP
jgi:hypothetical protein